MCCNNERTSSGITVRQCLDKIANLVEKNPMEDVGGLFDEALNAVSSCPSCHAKIKGMRSKCIEIASDLMVKMMGRR